MMRSRTKTWNLQPQGPFVAQQKPLMKPLLLFKSDQFSYSVTNFYLGLHKYIQIAMADLPVYS